MEEEVKRSAWEVICGEIDKIRDVLAAHPQLAEQILPSLEQIKVAVESAIPCPVIPALSMKEYAEHLPEAVELHSAVAAAGDRYEFHGYTFWPAGPGEWSLTNPYGMDDVMMLREVGDFARFLQLLRAGVIIYPS